MSQSSKVHFQTSGRHIQMRCYPPTPQFLLLSIVLIQWPFPVPGLHFRFYINLAVIPQAPLGLTICQPFLILNDLDSFDKLWPGILLHASHLGFVSATLEIRVGLGMWASMQATSGSSYQTKTLYSKRDSACLVPTFLFSKFLFRKFLLPLPYMTMSLGRKSLCAATHT